MPSMHRRSRLMAVAALVAGLGAGCGAGEAAPSSGVEVSGAWARTTASGATTGVVYLTIRGHQTDRLESLTVPSSIAASADLHQMVTVDGTVVAGSDGGGGAGGDHDHGGGGDGDGTDGDDTGSGADGGGDSGPERPLIMKPVTGGLAIPSGRDIVLGPGGYHIMLQELAHPLAAGDSFPLVLHFQRAGEQAVDVEVRDDAP